LQVEKRIIAYGNNLKEELSKKELDLEIRTKAFEKLFKEKTIGFPWLADAYADFEHFFEIETANYLRSKKHGAIKASELVSELSKEKNILKRELKLTKNYINYYESLFPWLKEYVDENLDDLLLSIRKENPLQVDEDPVRFYIGDLKYSSLTTIERNQLALDIYFAKRSNWQIGRDYERYIGYIYELEGYDVSYYGINEGLEDLGRDLICKRGNSIKIIQCKCWSKNKMIREKHINQLFGTTVKYIIDNKIEVIRKYHESLFPDFSSQIDVEPIFVTSTQFSPKAKDFAEALNVKLIENKNLELYPLIKCNIAQNGEKIYHLPFDQQYDNTKMNKPGCFYAFNPAEAEEKGFRGAYRWKGSS
jgi:hypothetical protein